MFTCCSGCVEQHTRPETYLAMDEETVSKYLAENKDFAKKWYKQNASNLGLNEAPKLSLSPPPPTPPPEDAKPSRSRKLSTAIARNFKISRKFNELLQEKKKVNLLKVVKIDDKRRGLAGKTEMEILHELIRDITTELDLNRLCYKILVNVSILSKSDKGSLFLATGNPGNKVLASKLFDVSAERSMEDCLVTDENQITIPFGVGIAGNVAQSNSAINIQDCYKDPRFNVEVDRRTGYRTQALLCMPINDQDGEVIGVAQIMNKTDGSQVFTQEDEKLFQTYLGFCGIGLANAQLFEMSVREFQRNELLLQLARNIFIEQTSLEKLVGSIMKDAKQVLDCERCSLYLVQWDQDEEDALGLPVSPTQRQRKRTIYAPQESLFAEVYELTDENNDINSPCSKELEISENTDIAKSVATSGEMLNIEISEENPDYKRKIKNHDGFEATSLLCIPVFDSKDKIVGVMQLMNKRQRGAKKRVFDDNDCNTAKTFAVFIGLGIYNCQMYENICMLMAKQKVALEVLSYHASASGEEANKLAESPIPSQEEFRLCTWDYDDVVHSEDDLCKGVIRMFVDLDFVSKFHIPYQALCRWTLSVKKNYRPVIYHNWRHAFNVTQTMFTLLQVAGMKKYMTDIQMFGLLVACLCHDLDHRGTNNTFQTQSDSPLSQLYTTSTMEHHHFDQCIMILNGQGNNIFQGLPAKLYRDAIDIVESAILATDLALYFQKKSKFEQTVEYRKSIDWKESSSNSLLRAMMMTACDVAAICKPWEIQYRVAHLVASEFFEQGDLERETLKKNPIAMMDRSKKDELPKMQVGFIDSICVPLYSLLSSSFDEVTILSDKCNENRELWMEEWTRCKDGISSLAKVEENLMLLELRCKENRERWNKLNDSTDVNQNVSGSSSRNGSTIEETPRKNSNKEKSPTPAKQTTQPPSLSRNSSICVII